MLTQKPLSFGVLAAVCFAHACATSHGVLPDSVPPPALQSKMESRAVNELIAEVDKEIQVEDQEAAQPAAAERPAKVATPEIPIEINSRVQGWVEYFTKTDTERFAKFLDRGETFRAAITKILKDNGVPTELYYLAMIESGFQIRAKSHASAVGVWQFIKPTAIRYGLRVDRFVDERVDPLRSTEAAASYLRDLYTVYQNWYLAMAAYNAGEVRILNAIMRSKTRDFWQLADENSLPRETLNYIPKFIAAASIGHHPEKFGFKVAASAPEEAVELVVVPGGVKLQDVAIAAEVPLAALKKSNPHLRRDITPPGKAGYQLWMPTGLRDKVAEVYAQLAVKQIKDLPDVASDVEEKYKWHRVTRGENLEVIAAKYTMSVQAIKRLNHLKSSRIFAGQRLRLTASSAPPSIVKKQRYRVQRGDNLTKIAEEFGLSLAELKRLNRLSSNKVVVGQRLLVKSL